MIEGRPISAAHLRSCLLAAVALLAVALGARAQTDLPSAGSSNHGWVVLPPSPDPTRSAGVYHFPIDAPPATVRLGPRLVRMPSSIAASGDRLYLVYDEAVLRASEPPAAGGEPIGPPRRRVQQVAVRQGLAPLFYDYLPQGREPETLPNLPDRGALEGVAATSAGPAALLREGDAVSIVLLRDLDWEVVEPPPLESSAGAALLASPTRLMLLERRPPDRAVLWWLPASEVASSGEWRSLELPLPDGADRFLTAGEQVIAAAEDGSTIRLWLLREGGAYPLAGIERPEAPHALFGAGLRIHLAWLQQEDSPRLMARVVSAVSGEIMHDGPVLTEPLVRGRELHTIALLLGFVLLTALIFVLRPQAGGRDAVAIPDGMSLAGPGRRFIALLIDAGPPLLISGAVFGVSPKDMVLTAMLVPESVERDAAAFLLGIAATIVHASVCDAFFGRSLGRLATSCRVASAAPGSARLRLWRAAARNAVVLLCPPLALFVLIDPLRRHPADVVTASVVVTPAPPPRAPDPD